MICDWVEVLKIRFFSAGEDYRFAYCYLDVLIRQYKLEPKINLFENPGYQYRDVHQRVKQADTDTIWGRYRTAKLFQKEYLAHPDWKIKITGLILPFWIALRSRKDFPSVLLRKTISFFLRLLTDCY